MYLIVGLGNPENEYANTRHNMGFDTINKIAKKNNIEVNKSKFKGIYGTGIIQNKKVILLKDNTVFMEGDTKEVYSQVELLKDNNFEIPDIVLFTYLAKNKKDVKIDYHRDIRDLIKDIYKHV